LAGSLRYVKVASDWLILGGLPIFTFGVTNSSIACLQTRLQDWKEGGLSGAYFYQRLRDINTVLQQYERSAVPPGWSCEWDRYGRFFCLLSVPHHCTTTTTTFSHHICFVSSSLAVHWGRQQAGDSQHVVG
jgi:hypothetical protein